MVGKKGFMRTVEILVAVIITFMFIIFVIPKYIEFQREGPDLEILRILEDDDEFRGCVLEEDRACVNSKINDTIPMRYDYNFDVSEDPGVGRYDLPEKHIYVETTYIAGNETTYTPKTVKLYYWIR